MLGSILILFLMPFIYTSETRNTTRRPIYKLCFWIFVGYYISLYIIAILPISESMNSFGQIIVFLYFFLCLILLPVASKIEAFYVRYLKQTRYIGLGLTYIFNFKDLSVRL